MAGEEDSFPLPFQLHQDIADVFDALVVEAVHGLIQNEKIGVLHDGLGDAKTLTHTKGIFPHMLLIIRVKSHQTDTVPYLLNPNSPTDGLQEVRDSIRLVGLDPDDKKHVGKYSLGMRQRLGIAQAIMEDPDLLILDEPMNGLDNQGVDHIRQVLLALKGKGKTIVLASHFMEDIAFLCDEVYRMDAGVLTKVEEKECL